MALLNWQDGTLLSKAKVTIGGIIYEVEPEQYSGQTPLSAQNLNSMQTQLIDWLYPIGSYYETSDNSFNPNTAWSGTWVLDSAGKVTVAQDTTDADFDIIGETGGEKTHTLSVNEMPAHYHRPGNTGTTQTNFVTTGAGDSADIGLGNGYALNQTTDTRGNSEAHNNLQPYIVVKRWHRTA